VEYEQKVDSAFDSERLLELPSFFSNLLQDHPSALQRLSPAALAYVGDAVYELYIRTCYLMPPKQLRVYHDQVVAQVRAESQADHLRSLRPHLTETELDILKRGRNAASRRPKRVDLETYQQATSLETLLGYLYLTDPQRLAQLLTQLQLEPPQAREG
jgi:ribonuclease-3 family protein